MRKKKKKKIILATAAQNQAYRKWKNHAVITGGIQLINVLELESVQGDGLVQNSERGALFQQLVQFQVLLLNPQRVLV